MGFGDHLEDLRRRIVLGFVGVLPIAILAFVFGSDLLGLVMRPLLNALQDAGLPPVLQQTAPLEGIYTYLKLSLVATVLVGAPWIIYQLWCFIAPGLYRHERKFVYLLLPMSGVLTTTAMAFLYYIVLPVILLFLIEFGTRIVSWDVDTLRTPPAMQLPSAIILDADPPSPEPATWWVNSQLNQLRIALPTGDGSAVEVRGVPLAGGAGVLQQYKLSEYVDTVFGLALAFGAGFQKPIVVLLLGWSGIIERA
ncbi:MAG: twin-arginine translocase subunit TatC, partial [Planctomycetota bacterium]